MNRATSCATMKITKSDKKEILAQIANSNIKSSDLEFLVNNSTYFKIFIETRFMKPRFIRVQLQY